MNLATRITILSLAAVTIALTVWVVSLRNEVSALRLEIGASRAERDAATKTADDASAQLAGAKENVERLKAERDALRKGSPAAPGDEKQTAAAAPTAPQFLGGLAQTFAGPEMRQMLRKEALAEAREDFADLVKKWNLPPADADQFLQFVADRDSADSDELAMLMQGKLDAASVAQHEERQAKAREESAAHLKALLGQARYAEFDAANKRREELEAVSSYRDHLEAAGAPLTDEQRSALAKIVTKEKPDENDWQKEDVEFFTQGMTDAQMAKLRQRQEAAQARIAQQSAGFLSPDQVNALQAAFKSEIQEQELAMKVARNLFQGGAVPAPAR